MPAAIAKSRRAARPSSPSRRGVGRPARVTPEQILDEAERIPLAELTLPLLAERLGIRTASLYHHFESREALLIALGGRCHERFELSPPDPVNWRRWLLDTAGRLYRLYIANPVLLSVQDRRHLRSRMPIAEAGLETLMGAGFGEQEALHAWNSVCFNILGYARSAAIEGSPFALDATKLLLVPGGEFPRMRAVLTSLMTTSGDRGRDDDAWLRWLIASLPDPKRR